jgi:hypothetical protein
MTGDRVDEWAWSQSLRRRGKCVVCGVEDYLVAMCGRCKKWSCEDEGCVRVVKEQRICAVPAVSL